MYRPTDFFSQLACSAGVTVRLYLRCFKTMGISYRVGNLPSSGLPDLPPRCGFRFPTQARKPGLELKLFIFFITSQISVVIPGGHLLFSHNILVSPLLVTLLINSHLEKTSDLPSYCPIPFLKIKKLLNLFINII